MEVMTGVMGSLLPKLAQLLKDQYGLQKGVKKKIMSVSKELEAAHTVLDKIGDVPVDQLDKQVRLWASEVREASYDTEDIVDKFLVRVEEDPNESTKPYVLRRLMKKVGRLFKKIKARHNISSLIDEMNEKFQEVEARRRRYALNGIDVKPAALNTIDPRIHHLFKVATEKLVGIERPRDELINMLSLGDRDLDLSSATKMKIVSIVGFGGLGKTTLAKSVYDNLKQGFECWAFVPVGRNPDIKKVLRDTLIGLDEQTYNHSTLMGFDENQLMGKLNKFVKEKRCLIVIDDIWDKKTWEFVRRALQESKCGGRLLITTRICEVAAYAGEVYRLQPLSHDNSKELLSARIVDGEGKHGNSPSAEACERILKKCGGVPLAIITIASLLASKPEEDWSEIYNSIGFGHKGNDVVDNTRKILSFSYYDLPSHLKTCLLYLSVFPEDHVIEKNSLIWMWIAEGFISEEQAAAAGVGSLFDLGQRYFNELINRSMIQGQESKYEGYVDACSVHDMVLDLIHQLSSEENFVTVLNGGEKQKLKGSISRRLALQHGGEHNIGPLASIAVEKVRSIYACRCDFAALCPRLPFLRVVEIVRCSVWNNQVLDLRSSLHLRYLRLSGMFGLPREVRYLRFLQTLDVRYSGVEQLPREVGLLTQLVCLRADDQGITVPVGLISKLTSLQELRICCKYHDASVQIVKELGLLRELRVLRIVFSILEISEGGIGSALLESLGSLLHIQELQITNVYGKVVVSVARRVSCQHLHLLDLCNFMFSNGLPMCIKSTKNLSYLRVDVVAVEDQDMETLAKLPELSCLILHFKSDTKSIFSIKIRTDEGVGYFRKLRFLDIGGAYVRFDLCSNECSSSRVPSSNTIMPSLESLKFEVHVRSLKDENLQFGFDKMLGFQILGTSSLQRVNIAVNTEGSSRQELKEAEAALKHTAAVHPNHPTLQTYMVGEDDMILSFYLEAWKLAEDITVGSGRIQILRLPDPAASPSKQIFQEPECLSANRFISDVQQSKERSLSMSRSQIPLFYMVIRLFYSDNGVALLALSSNAVHKWWKWKHSDENLHVKWSKSVPSILWPLEKGTLTINDTTNGNPEEPAACILPSRNEDYYVVFYSGGKFSLFSMMTSEVTDHDRVAAPTAATFLAFHPQNHHIMAMGMEDSSILIYYPDIKQIQHELTGHQKNITGLAFSASKNVLISSGADAQLCVWETKGRWGKLTSTYIQSPPNFSGALVGDTMVQIDHDEKYLLVVHESQLAIYDWLLKCSCSWFPRNPLPAPISSAVYSLGSLLVFAGFCDGAVGIFEAKSLTLQCRMAPSAYIPSSISSGETVYPTAIATHPQKPNQIAVGMSDGAVLVLEPLDTDDDQEGSNISSEHPSSDVSALDI